MAQTIIKGIDSLKSLTAGRKVLLVKDEAYRFLPICQQTDSASAVAFSGFTPNPLYEQVAEGIKVFNESRCDMIIAVGGGSSIDVAKCIKLYCRMKPDTNYLKQEMFDSGIPLIAIPTTAGTGSESTQHAVIYYNGAKQSVSHPSIIPDYAILEPSVLKTLPLYQKKCTMLDALCQGLESWWSVGSTDESKKYSRIAVELIRDNWRDYIENNTYSAAEKIMEAANYSGRAINITATTAAHAMSYKLTSLYKLPHGHAVAICMPEVWKHLLANTDSCIDPRGAAYLRDTVRSFPVDEGWFEKLMAELCIESPVSASRENDISILADSVNATRLKNFPITLEKQVLINMYERIVK